MGIRNYKCEFCSKAFYRKEYLVAHLASHPEFDPEKERLKMRRKPGPKPRPKPAKVMQIVDNGVREAVKTMILQPCDSDKVATVVLPGPAGDATASIIQWTGGQQNMVACSVAGLDAFQSKGQAVTVQPGGSFFTEAAGAHNVTVSLQNTGLQQIQHPISRLVSSHSRPFTVTVSAQGQPVEIVHAAGSEMLLQPNAGSVQYEVECDPANLTEADINAIRLLAAGQLHG
jgi:hypothetical protein